MSLTKKSDNPLSEPMLAYFAYVYMRHLAWMS